MMKYKLRIIFPIFGHLGGIPWTRPHLQSSPNERGQIVVLSAIILTVLLGFSALAIDVGFWLHTRTKLQADADAMALAGAQKLCAKAECDASAESLAESYAPKNAVKNSETSVDVDVTCDGDVSHNHDTITVHTQRNVPTLLAGVLGITDADITACATARKAAVAGGTGIVPFGIEDDCLGAGVFGDDYKIKYDAAPDSVGTDICDKTGGNFGLLAIDTSGAGAGCGSPPDTATELKLKQAICFGANRFLCARGASDCVGVPDNDTCSGGHAADDQTCNEPGNTTSAIKEGIGYRMSEVDPKCDTWEEVTYPSGGLRQECNPWINKKSTRIIMIPVVDGLFTGTSGNTKRIVDVVDFAIFFLEDFVEKDCKGDDCDITGRFIKTSLSGSYQGLDDLNENSSLTVVVLVN
jgi:hypothetical protein